MCKKRIGPTFWRRKWILCVLRLWFFILHNSENLLYVLRIYLRCVKHVIQFLVAFKRQDHPSKVKRQAKTGLHQILWTFFKLFWFFGGARESFPRVRGTHSDPWRPKIVHKMTQNKHFSKTPIFTKIWKFPKIAGNRRGRRTGRSPFFFLYIYIY